MPETECCGMQRLAAQCGDGRIRGVAEGAAPRPPRAAAIDRVADHRMADMRHMNTDLMCSASFKTAFNMRTKRRETAQQLPMRYRVTAFGGDGLAFAIIAGAADWLVNRAITFNTCSPNKRLIAPVNIMCGKHSGQAVMRRICLGSGCRRCWPTR